MANGKHGTPTVALDSEDISQEMAARLTIALLGQVLYMKGQVPFPISSLGNAGCKVTENASRASTRARQRRMEFIDSYDDLTSHLHTTFVALSTALSKNVEEYPPFSAATSTPSPHTQPKILHTFSMARRLPAKIYIFLILGPSPSIAKARYLLEFDGFRVEQFGEWEYTYRDRNRAEWDRCSSENEDEPVASSSSSEPLNPPSTPSRTPPPEYADDWQTPISSSSKVSYDSGLVVSSPSATSSESDLDSDNEGPSKYQSELSERFNSLALAQTVEEASLRTGERLLYRALFTGDDILGLGNEISPTQVHVLIRAPRRFTHPTWVPRQGLGSMLDRQVQCFLESESHSSGTSSTRQRNNTSFGVGRGTVGIRVTCRGKIYEHLKTKPSDTVDPSGMNVDGVDNEAEDAREEESKNEEDELIWWSWNGKLIGFSE